MEASSGSTGEDNQGARLCSEISWAANGGNGDATEQGTLLQDQWLLFQHTLGDHQQNMTVQVREGEEEENLEH